MNATNRWTPGSGTQAAASSTPAWASRDTPATVAQNAIRRTVTGQPRLALYTSYPTVTTAATTAMVKMLLRDIPKLLTTR